MKRYILFSGIVILLLGSCTTDNTAAQEIKVMCGDTTLENPLTYTFTITGRWNTTNFDNELVPKNAHFSPIVIFTHKADENIFLSGEEASPELEELAELGHTSIKNIAKTNDAIACSYVDASTLSPSGTSHFEIQVTSSFNTVTILSMIAPSSDWFVSTRLSLYDSDTFVKEGEANFNNYDAGTEKDDNQFSLSNDAEPTQKNITKLTNPFPENTVLMKVSYTQ